MSDDGDNAESPSEDEDLRSPMAGERLAEARRAKQIPVIEIAKEIHLDEFKVRALERNDFDVIGAPVFAKGHLRKYAQLVNVDEADVMADYYELNRSSGAPPVVSTRPKHRQVASLGPWVAAIVVILVVAAAYWWFAASETAPELPVTGRVAPLPQEVDVADQPAISGSDAIDNAASETQAAARQPDLHPQIETIITTDADEMQLSITYSGDCWTEITDASGRRLFFELGKAGRTVNLSGEAPFNVLFGDAANVSLTVNGRSFDIPSADRRGRTARLTITG